jgi:7-dehydrocholesterol reductase
MMPNEARIMSSVNGSSRDRMGVGGWTVAGAGAVLLGAPLCVAYVWICCRAYGGALSGPLVALAADGPRALRDLLAAAPRPTASGFAIFAAWYLLQAVLMLVLPGRTALGAVTPAGHQLEYRVNGALAWLVTHALLYLAAFQWRLFRPTIVYEHWGGLFVAANTAGVLVALAAYCKARRAPSHADDRRFGGNVLHDFFAGIELNPRIGRFDLKLFHVGRVGMSAWTVINLSFAAQQYATLGRLTASMLVLNVLQLVYVLDLFWREDWYVRTIDIQHDRFGFYLAWGSVVWLPFMYTLPAAYLVTNPVDLSPAAAGAILALGLAGYTIFLSANRQRDRFRRTGGGPCRIAGRDATFVPARYVSDDGRVHDARLLTSGWWALSRHPNYIGDVVMAAAFSLTCGFGHVLPYFYAVYLPALLVHRAWRDEARCRAKYGVAWDVYRATVPARIVPRVW